MKIVKTLIKTSVDVLCPSCKKLVARVSAHSIDTPDSRVWMRLGEAIMASWAQSTMTSDSGAFLAWDSCLCCGEEYDVARGDFLKHSRKTTRSFLPFDLKKVRVNHYLCRLDEPVAGMPKKWLLFEYITPVGKFHSHRLGPFPDARNYSRANRILRTAWESMRQMNLDDSEKPILINQGESK